MFELVIKDVAYPLNFGMGFVRKLDRSVNIPVDGLPGVKKEIGLSYAIMSLAEKDIAMLENVLLIANEGQNPRLTQDKLDAHLEDAETDIAELFDNVMTFFRSANCTKLTAEKVDEAVKKAKEEEAEKKEKN